MSELSTVKRLILVIVIVGMGFWVYDNYAKKAIDSTTDLLGDIFPDGDIVSPTEANAVSIHSRQPNEAAVGDCAKDWGYQPFEDVKIDPDETGDGKGSIYIRFSEEIGTSDPEGTPIMPDFVTVYGSAYNREEIPATPPPQNRAWLRQNIRPTFATKGETGVDRSVINISIFNPGNGLFGTGFLWGENYYLLIMFETENTQLTPTTLAFPEGKTLEDKHNCLITEVS